LVATGLFSSSAIIAYVMGDVKDRTQRNQALVQERRVERARGAELVHDRAKFDSQNEKVVQEWAQLRGQYDTIIQSLQRIEKAAQSSAQ
jgi:hypothetical protein